MLRSERTPEHVRCDDENNPREYTLKRAALPGEARSERRAKNAACYSAANERCQVS